MARLQKEPYELPEMKFGPGDDFDSSEHEKAFNELLKTSSQVPEGSVVGYLWSHPVADGHAYYLVTKESPLTLQHVDYMDAWSVAPYVIRGLTRADIEERIALERKLKFLFHRLDPIV